MASRPPAPARTVLALAFSLGGAVLALGCGDVRLFPIQGDKPPSPGDGSPPPTCPSSLIGFATLGGGTTGGGGGETVTVRSADQAAAARFAEEAARVEPLIIQVEGIITLPEQTDVASNKTILGVGASSGFTGHGLDLNGSENVILRNLIISKAVKSDAVTLQQSRRIWIDHCDLSSDGSTGDEYDGLVDVTHASDFVTISWTRFHDHVKTTLVGHSADNMMEDMGHLTVTYHHNAFINVRTGVRIRFGEVHAFNNYFLNVPEFGFVSQMGAEVFIENNVFENVGTGDPSHYAITTVYMDPVEGLARVVGNLFTPVGADRRLISMETDWSPAPFYPHTPDSAENAQALVQACAGVGQMLQ